MDKQLRLLLVSSFSALVLLGVFLAIFVSQKPPETYSELYIVSQTIPKQTVSSKLLSFSFGIENHENRKVNYFCEIYVDNESEIDSIVPVDKNEGTILSSSVPLKKGKHKITIVVKKPDNKLLSTWFWVEVI